MAKKTKLIEVTIPENWSEVKYSTYYRFIEAIKEEEENTKLVIEMALLYLCNVDPKDYNKLPADKIVEISTAMLELLDNQGDGKLITKFTTHGQEYRLDPNLENMPYGMYLDLSNYAKDLWANMPIIASILYRPLDKEVGKDYTVRPYKGTSDDTVQMFKEGLTMDIANAIVAFFLNLQQQLLNDILHSSTKKAKSLLTSLQAQTSVKSGQGIKPLLSYLKTVFSNLRK